MKKRGLAALLTLDVAFLCGMTLVGLGFIWDSLRLNPMAARLPQNTAILMIALILFVLYGKVRDALKVPKAVDVTAAAAPVELPVEVVEEELPQVTGRRLHWSVAWLIIATYPFLVLLLGFSIATLVFLTCVSIIMGTKLRTGIIYGVIGSICMVILFIFMLKVPMPDSALSEYIPALLGY